MKEEPRAHRQISISWWTCIIHMEFLLQFLDVALVAVVVEVVFAMQVLYKICDALQHLIGRQIVDIVL